MKRLLNEDLLHYDDMHYFQNQIVVYLYMYVFDTIYSSLITAKSNE